MPVAGNIQFRDGEKSLASDVKAFSITSALNNMKTQTLDSYIQGSVKVFGCYGVGGITTATDEICVKINGSKAEVFLTENIYDSLLRKVISEEPEALAKGNSKEGMKKLLLKPDELAKIKEFTNCLPVFKAISSCSLSIVDVAYESPEIIRKAGEVLEKEHQVISEKESSGFTGKSIREFGTDFVVGTMERYNENKLPSAQAPAEKIEKEVPAKETTVEGYAFVNKNLF
jgi:hypothetical protein